YVRIKVLEGVRRISISSFTPIEICDTNTQKLLLKEPSVFNFEIKPVSRGLSLNGVIVDAKNISIDSQPLGIIALGKRQYRGKIECRRQPGNSLLVINELPVEEYLYGVLKYEVSPKWPRQALKAQAIVARTFALNKVREKINEDYHLTNTVLSQVYAGFSSEDPVLTEVINETHGMVLTYQGEIIPAYYHATCGGYTESPKYVWSKSLPYLRVRRCPYCQDSPHFYWKNKLGLRRIRQAFQRAGYKFNRIIKLKPLGKSPSGRLKKILIYHNRGEIIVKSNDLRLIIGPDIIKSTNFRMKRVDQAIEFSGKGWGHGVGLCQWGARGMARKGYKYDKILNFYYPGTRIETVY
ncbi:MAG: SpoIID/LytB domain-containing protein, partial [Candidatus Ratteibacteria bacterium]|nr:SpoIID/LytB domain-containing protein [Candidatus Ratteibacteria bacterium]